MDIELLSYIKKSSQRKSILLSLNKILTPTEIKDKTKLAPAQISRTLREFLGLELVECLNPNEKTGRLYKRTQKGDKISQYLE